jgi:hypothetical protein
MRYAAKTRTAAGVRKKCQRHQDPSATFGVEAVAFDIKREIDRVFTTELPIVGLHNFYLNNHITKIKPVT